jgi:hypothetical protein
LAYATITGGALSAFTLGLAAPAMAAPSGVGSGHDTVTELERDGHHTASTTQHPAPLDRCWLRSVRTTAVVEQAVQVTAWC